MWVLCVSYRMCTSVLSCGYCVCHRMCTSVLSYGYCVCHIGCVPLCYHVGIVGVLLCYHMGIVVCHREEHLPTLCVADVLSVTSRYLQKN